MADYTGQTIKNQEINLLNNENLLHKLSHGMIMEDCVINFKVPANGIIIAKAQFINCTLNFKTKLTNYSFSSTIFDGCKFTGKLSGCEFGYRKKNHNPEQPEIKGNIINCDFSEVAFANGIRFFNCDTATIKFPKFPHFFIKDPYQNAPIILENNFPKSLKTLFGSAWLTEADNALLLNIDEAAQKDKISVEEFKSLISAYDFIEM